MTNVLMEVDVLVVHSELPERYDARSRSWLFHLLETTRKGYL